MKRLYVSIPDKLHERLKNYNDKHQGRPIKPSGILAAYLEMELNELEY